MKIPDEGEDQQKNAAAAAAAAEDGRISSTTVWPRSRRP
jgi:hypothetical protein